MPTINSELFEPDLLSLGHGSISDQVAKSGVFTIEKGLKQSTVDRILAELGSMDIRLNENDVGPVLTPTQAFFTHFMARSKTAYDVVTSDLTLGVCSRLMKNYALAGKRIYTTKVGMHMQWHCDIEAPCTDPYDVDATVFIYYLTDVADGEWQYVAGSHLLGENFVGGRDMDKVIESRFANDIRSVPGRRGTIVIYNGRTFHRAKPMSSGSPPRTSLFFQVNKDIAGSEPILLNAAFLENLDEQRKKFLNFGNAPQMPVFPKTDIYNIGTSDLMRLWKSITKQTVGKFLG